MCAIEISTPYKIKQGSLKVCRLWDGYYFTPAAETCRPFSLKDASTITDCQMSVLPLPEINCGSHLPLGTN